MLFSSLSLALLGAFAFTPALALASPVQDEVEHAAPEFRQQLGTRVIRMEQAFEVAGEKQRAGSIGELIETVEEFFSARVQSAAQGLDLATAYLEGRTAPLWSDSLAFTCHPWLEEQGAACRVSLAQFYSAAVPPDAQYRVLGHETWQALGPLPITLLLDPRLARVTELSEADQHLSWTIQIREANGEILRSEDFHFSRVANFRQRARQVQSVERRWREEAETWRSETARIHLELLFALSRGQQQEIWLDGARLLQAAEQLVGESANPASTDTLANWIDETPYLNGSHIIAWPGPEGQGRQISRIQFPSEAEDEQLLPTVIALHGAGGTENMFFSSYGAGKITELAQDGKFLLLSPRVPGSMNLVAYVNAAIKHLPIDKNRIYVVGHSMGAGVIQRAVFTPRANFQASALLGGGREHRQALPDELPPLFLGAGEKDFALGGLTALDAQLTRHSPGTTTFKVYPNTEHLTVVQVALPEVFEWFKEIDEAYLAKTTGD